MVDTNLGEAASLAVDRSNDHLFVNYKNFVKEFNSEGKPGLETLRITGRRSIRTRGSTTLRASRSTKPPTRCM